MKTMKSTAVLYVASIVCICLLGAGTAFGANRKGGNQCTVNLASQLVPVEEMTVITGIVSDVANPGLEISIDDGDEVVLVYGIGPYFYWNELDIPRPDVGDAITVKGLDVTYSDGSVKFIVFFVTVTEGDGEIEIQLRDTETGLPLWRTR